MEIIKMIDFSQLCGENRKKMIAKIFLCLGKFYLHNFWKPNGPKILRLYFFGLDYFCYRTSFTFIKIALTRCLSK